MQRLRITFSKGPEIKYISHLDLLRMWERILRRAGVPLAYTRGFNPHPRLALAAPLPVGVLGSAEMLEIFLESLMPIPDFEQAIARQLPSGVQVSRIEEVDERTPSLPSVVRAAEYEALVTADVTRREVVERIDRLLWTPRLPRVRRRAGEAEGGHLKEARQYDLRPLIEDVWIERWNGEKVIGMRLRADPSGTGRPEEVLEELRLRHTVGEITRTKLLFVEHSREGQSDRLGHQQ
ncbi:MAG: TIGR03936 family radical SAM-associated protein [Chloroflexi bacterium]|nr:TIGR03936 family radical SAM-associated protein [Chloroflexota bacterium]